MKIKLIYAHDKNRLIGKNGVMPWHLPEDMAHFKALTLHHPVLMGRSTWDSIPLAFRPLKERRNIVLTRNPLWSAAGAESAASLEAALQRLQADKADIVWVMGGAQVYAQALPWAEKIIATEIDAAFDGDAYAPELGAEWVADNGDWNLSQTGLRYRFNTWTKK